MRRVVWLCLPGLFAQSGCLGYSVLVADTPQSPEATLEAVRREAPAHHLDVSTPKTADLDKRRPGEPSGFFLAKETVHVRAAPHGAGTRLVLTYNEDSEKPPGAEQAAGELLTSLSGHPPVHAREITGDLEGDEPALFDLRAGFAGGHLGGHGSWFRSDVMAIYGKALTIPSAPVDAPAARYRWAFLGGFGASVAPGRTGEFSPGARVEAGLAIDRRMFYRPLDKSIETGLRRRAELTVAGLWFPGQDRLAVEATASANLAQIGGLFVTGGRMWDLGGADGNYWLIGIRLGAVSWLVVLASPYLLFSLL